jgi:serine O-acetyltransferase
VLGSFTVGAGARVGANAVVLSPVPPGVTVVGVPAKPVTPRTPEAVRSKEKDCEFLPYGTPCDEIPDPVARVLSGLAEDLTALRARVAELEGRPTPEGEVVRLEARGMRGP